MEFSSERLRGYRNGLGLTPADLASYVGSRHDDPVLDYVDALARPCGLDTATSDPP